MSIPFVTADLPGTGGRLKERPGDFLVEELPLYRPSGAGEHLYLWLEKEGLTTDEVAVRAARAFGVGRGSIGMAGLKDRQAVARQWLSVHAPGVDDRTLAAGIERLRADPAHLRVQDAGRHANKLRLGHLAGNRFILKLRGVGPEAAVRARPALARLAAGGCPQFFGAQRFGFRGDSGRMGALLLRGDLAGLTAALVLEPHALDSEPLAAAKAAARGGKFQEALELCPRGLHLERELLDALSRGVDAAAAPRRARRERLSFLVAAAQSEVFNRVLAARVADGSWRRLLEGDVAVKHVNGAPFDVDAAAAEADNAPGGRVDKLEVSATGPLWGGDMRRAGGAVDALERAALAESGLAPESFAACPLPQLDNLHGSRRPLRMAVTETALRFAVDEHGPFLELAFVLPKGAYATEVMREVMKVEGLEEA